MRVYFGGVRRAGSCFADGRVLVLVEVFVRAFGYQKRDGRFDVCDGDCLSFSGLFGRLLLRLVGIARTRVPARIEFTQNGNQTFDERFVCFFRYEPVGKNPEAHRR